MKKPEPVIVGQVCSLCGLDWDAHGDKPTALTCIELLRAELTRQPQTYWTINNPMLSSGTTTYSGGIANPQMYLVGNSGTESFKPPDDPDMGVPAKVS